MSARGGSGGPVRVGVVGCGAVAQAVHLPLLAKRRDLFQVTGLCDLSPRLVGHVAERFGLAAAGRHHDAEELLESESERLDAVMVLASGSHAPVAAAALRRGLPVLCEKPLSHTLAEADALAGLARSGAPRVQVGYMKLYDPAVTAAVELLAGRPAPRAVTVTVLRPSEADQLAHARLEPEPADVPAARREALAREGDELVGRALGRAPRALRRLYVDVLLGSMVHNLSLVRALAGEVQAVEHVAMWPDGPPRPPEPPPPGPPHPPHPPHPPGPPPPSVSVDAVLPGGARLAVWSHYLARYPSYREEVQLHYEDGSVLLTFPSPYLLHAPTVLTVRERAGEATSATRRASAAEAFERQLEAFHRLVTEGRPPAAGIAEGRADVLTCQRIVRQLAGQRGLPIGGEAARAPAASTDPTDPTGPVR